MPLLWLLAACLPAGGPDASLVRVGPCQPGGAPGVDLAHGDDAWNQDPLTLEVGIPPQGGAPYTRIQLRVQDLDLAERGAVVIDLRDSADQTYLGGLVVSSGWVCANTGDDADHWVATEFHARFDGYTVDELVGLEVLVSAFVTASDQSASWSGQGTLTPLQ